MPKSKKTAKKSRRGDKRKTSGEAKQEATPPVKPKVKFVLTCDFCNKPMKDLNTKNLHEINCKKKIQADSDEPDKAGLDRIISKLKGDFDEQKQFLTDQFEDREQKLETEIKELREVLRLEIEHRHKELERLNKVETKVPEQQLEITPQPKAIDMIPLPLPQIPKPRIDIAREPNLETMHMDAIVPPQKQEIQVPKELPREEPTGVTSPSKEELLAMVRAELEPVASKIKEIEGAKLLQSPSTDVYVIELENLASEITKNKKSLEDEISKLVKKTEHDRESELKRIDRELNKFSERIIEIMDEIGFGESLSVTKIPPTILEIVYQATLDDLNVELNKALGTQDAEKIARLALEEVRLKTSGSELFKFDGRKIVTDSLAKSLEANLISAKQIQTTYDELLSRLLENLPHYKAKNFRAMIKVKSQEFAVDRATILSKEFERLQKTLESTEHMIAALSSQVNVNNLKLQEELKDIKEKWLASKADSLEVEALRDKLAERDQREVMLAKEIALIKAQLEMRDAIAENLSETTPEDEHLMPAEAPGSAAWNAILDAVFMGASSKSAIIKKTGLDDAVIKETLSNLIAENKIVEVKAGKRVKYMTPGQALEEKLEEHMDSEKAIPEKAEESPIYELGEPIAESQEAKAELDSIPAQAEVMEEVKPASEPQQIVMEPEPDKAIEEPTREPVSLPVEDKKEVQPEPELPHPEPAAELKEELPAEEKEITKPLKEKAEPKKKVKKEKKKKEKVDKKKEAPMEEKPTPKRVTQAKKQDKKEKEPAVKVESVNRSLAELSEDEKKVLASITAQGVTVSAIQSKAGKGLKYAALLRALRNLIDSGYVGIVTKGKMTLYQKITVEKMDKQKNEENKTEVN
jgi:hypothetical protein